MDARERRVIERWNGLTTVDQGSGPGGNSKKAITWSSELDVVKAGELYKMDTEGCGDWANSCGQVAPFGCYCDAICSQRGDCCADAGTCR